MLLDIRLNFWKLNKDFLENVCFLDIGHALNHEMYTLNLHQKKKNHLGG